MGFSPAPHPPDAGSAAQLQDCLGHFWKATLGHFSQAPKAGAELDADVAI